MKVCEKRFWFMTMKWNGKMIRHASNSIMHAYKNNNHNSSNNKKKYLFLYLHVVYSYSYTQNNSKTFNLYLASYWFYDSIYMMIQLKMLIFFFTRLTHSSVWFYWIVPFFVLRLAFFSIFQKFYPKYCQTEFAFVNCYHFEIPKKKNK